MTAPTAELRRLLYESVYCPSCNSSTVPVVCRCSCGQLIEWDRVRAHFRDCENGQLSRIGWRARCPCGWSGLITELIGGTTLAIQGWANFLTFHFPDEFREPEISLLRTPNRPGTPEKVDTMEDRANPIFGRKPLSIWHPRDARMSSGQWVAQEAENGRNGRRLREYRRIHVMTVAEEPPEDEEMATLPGPFTSIMERLESRGIRVGNLNVKPCPECGWRHVRHDGLSWDCCWCGEQVDEPFVERRPERRAA